MLSYLSISYETDLIRNVENEEGGIFSVAVSEKQIDTIKPDLSVFLSHRKDEALPEEYLSVVSVLPAQIIGFFKSIVLGLKPNKPTIGETITRIVKGVTIYPFD